MVALTSCIDNDYDLSDVESTVRIEVNSLVVPVNLDDITMESIIDIKEGDAVQIVNGQYAIVRDGNVNAEQINIPAVTVTAPTIAPTETTVHANSSASVKASGTTVSFPLSSTPSDCEYSTSDVSEYIVGINSCKCTATLDMKVTLVEALDKVRATDFSDIVFQLPKGMILSDNAGGKYNPETGELYIASSHSTGSYLTLHLEASGMDFTKADATYNNPTLTLDEKIYLKSGVATISADDVTGGISNLPTSLTLRTEYQLSDINISSFSGRIKYDVNEVNIPDIDLNDLPDVLSQESTNISITNPCLYLQLDNPLQSYNLIAQSGLSMTAVRPTGANVYGLDDGESIVIRTNHPNALYNYCLSPDMPENIDPEFSDAEHVGYKSLSNVLSGSGIPKSIKVDLLNPNIPDQPVSDFTLGVNMGEIGGRYKLVAPLSFMEGSHVIYTYDMDGWNDKEFDKVTITSLDVTMVVSTDIPVSLDFTGYPIDVEGNRINNVEITGAQVNANAVEQEITLHVTGEVKHLDGIRYIATASAATDAKAITPEMAITLKNVRPVVSGYYEKEL